MKDTQKIVNKAAVSSGIVTVAIEARPGAPLTVNVQRELTVLDDSGRVLARSHAGDALVDLDALDNAEATVEVSSGQELTAAEAIEAILLHGAAWVEKKQ